MNLEKVMNKRSPNGDVGIEVEVEFKDGRVPTNIPTVRNWYAKEDGSLRAGREFVTRLPVKADGSLKTKRLGPLFDAIGSLIVDDSPRTSCHVHVNALRLTPIEVCNAMVLYWLVENVLYDVCGDERKRNGYSARLIDNPNYINQIIELVKTCKMFTSSTYRGEISRYSSMNLAALNEHGSIEYRGMYGNYNTDSLANWVFTLNHIQNVMSKKFSDPLQIMDKYISSSNVPKFLQNIIGPFITDLDFSDKKLDLCEQNAITIAGFCYMHEPVSSWERWQTQLFERIKKRDDEQLVSTSTDQSPTTTPTPSTVSNLGVECLLTPGMDEYDRWVTRQLEILHNRSIQRTR